MQYEYMSEPLDLNQTSWDNFLNHTAKFGWRLKEAIPYPRRYNDNYGLSQYTVIWEREKPEVNA